MGKKILIVDDEPNLLRMTGYALHREGYEVIVAQTGEEALTKVQADQPDLAILDVMLPDMHGIEICERLRNNPDTTDIPIIMLSARAQVEDKVRGLKAGADEYVTKPIDMDELTVRVEMLLERTRRRLETQPAKGGRVLGFIGAKGGVGTTTVAINVALALTDNLHSVGAVELHPGFGTFALQLGRTPIENLKDLLHFKPEEISPDVVKKALAGHATGLRVLFGPQSIDKSLTIEADQARAIVKGLARLHEYTVIDLPAYPTEANRAAIDLCHFLALVVEVEPAAIVSAKAMIELLKAWGVAGEKAGLVLVSRLRYDDPIPLREVEAELGYRVVGVMPPSAELCRKAIDMQAAVLISQPISAIANALTELADRLAMENVPALAL